MSRLLKIPEAAAELSIGRSRLYELLQAGEIKAVKIGTRGVRVPTTELDRFVADRLHTNEARTPAKVRAQEVDRVSDRTTAS